MIGTFSSEKHYKEEVMMRMTALGWRMQAHEDMYDKFIPDLSFAAHGKDGWIEIKYLKSKPKTLGHIPHYTVGQQEWLVNRGRTGGGLCYLMVGVRDGGHYVWRWDMLRKIRSHDWADAIHMAEVSGGLTDTLRGLDAVVRRRGRG